jgi:hypothetical protein
MIELMPSISEASFNPMFVREFDGQQTKGLSDVSHQRQLALICKRCKALCISHCVSIVCPHLTPAPPPDFFMRIHPHVVPPLVLTLAAALLVAACGDDGTESTPDATADTSEGSGADAVVDTSLPDVVEDVLEPDSTDGSSSEDVAPDVAPELDVQPDDVQDAVPEDAADAADGSAEMDIVMDVDTGPVIPPLEDCTPDGGECELPYSCIEGVCRLPIASRSMCEDLDDFEIAQPEELTEIFVLLKSLAVDNRFLLLDPLPGSTPLRVETEYGSANVEDASGAPIAVSWQTFVRDRIFFTPDATDPRGWISEEFFYDLNALVTFTFPGFGTQTASLGFETEEVTLSLILDEDGLVAQGVLEGYMRRTEAESRVMISVEEAGTIFPALLCPPGSAYLPDDDVWHLSDLMDCNLTPLDHDIDGDTVLDSYFVRMEVGFVTASIVAP